jgi:glycosyltransferase involved in cell wall biosynthesis
MRILVFSHEFPPMQGGEGTYAFELSVGLAKLGHDVSVLAGTPLTDAASDVPVDDGLRAIGIEVERHDWVKRERLWFLHWRKRLRDYLDRQGPFDHLFLANFTSCVVAQHFKPQALPPYSITLHGDDIDYFFTRKKWKSYVLISRSKARRLFRGAAKLICVSDYTRQKLLESVPFVVGPVVVHHGIEPPDGAMIAQAAAPLHERFLAQRCIEPGTTILGYVSRLEARKGQDRLIRCLGQDADLAGRTHTVFVGGGSRLAELQAAVIAHGLEDRVTFTGEIPREEVMKYLSFSDLSVFLSDHPRETFGIVLLEAMAMGKPVLALRHGGMIEVVEDGVSGFLVTETQVADRLRQLVNDVDLRAHMGAAGRLLVETKFNNRVMAERSIAGLLEPCAVS